MPSIVVNSAIFADIYGSAEMRAIFSDRALLQHYLDVEVALATAQAKLGLIPERAAAAIADVASVERVDMERLARRTKIVGYPILPLVEQMCEWADDGLGQYAHWGATTQDIMDTADVLQIRLALDLAASRLDAIADALARLAHDHRTTVMAGRTHLQHALPISFGYKCATWLAGIDRHRNRLKDVRSRVEVVQFSGAAGTLASLGEDGLAVQEGLARELGLGCPDITWHTIRDGFAEVTGLLALITGSIGKIGYDIMLLMQTEVGEALEPYVVGRGASSTMPQKRNPIASEMMLAGAKIVREQHAMMLDAMVQDHERATGQWQVEWHAVPTAFIVADGALNAACETLAGLDVRPERMAEVLGETKGLIVAEAVMMGLAPKLGRQIAHDLVYECCHEALTDGADFVDALFAKPEVSRIADRDTLERLTDPANYLGAAPAMVDALLKRRARRLTY